MKSLIVARLGAAIAGAVISAAALAQGPGSMGGPGLGMEMHRPPFERAFGGRELQGRWWNNPRVIERLKLTDDQRKAFDQILLDHREKLVDLQANVEKAELKLEPLIGNDQPNESAILAQIDKVAQARAELIKANARYLLALRSKLTPDQWKMVQEFRRTRQHERWNGPERHLQPGPEGPETAPAPAAPGPQGAIEDGVGPDAPAQSDAPAQLSADAGAPGEGIF